MQHQARLVERSDFHPPRLGHTSVRHAGPRNDVTAALLILATTPRPRKPGQVEQQRRTVIDSRGVPTECLNTSQSRPPAPQLTTRRSPSTTVSRLAATRAYWQPRGAKFDGEPSPNLSDLALTDHPALIVRPFIQCRRGRCQGLDEVGSERSRRGSRLSAEDLIKVRRGIEAASLSDRCYRDW